MSDSAAQPAPGLCSKRSTINAKFIATASGRSANVGCFERKAEGNIELNFSDQKGCTPWDVFAAAIQVLSRDWDVGKATHFKISVRLQPGTIEKMHPNPMNLPVIAP